MSTGVIAVRYAARCAKCAIGLDCSGRESSTHAECANVQLAQSGVWTMPQGTLFACASCRCGQPSLPLPCSRLLPSLWPSRQHLLLPLQFGQGNCHCHYAPPYSNTVTAAAAPTITTTTDNAAITIVVHANAAPGTIVAALAVCC